MSLIKNLNNWLAKKLWHPSDTNETLEQKVYLVRNGVIAATIITVLVVIPFLILGTFHLMLLAIILVLAILITDGLLMIIRRGIKWFLYFYYGGYIAICTLVILDLGGLPNSVGVWGGSFIVFMHSIAVRDKKIVIVNAVIYLTGLVVIVLSYPYISPSNDWSPEVNNLMFTINESWMGLFLVKSFYDSIVTRTNEANRRAAQLVELDLLKSRLYANITHEFRTPLTLIRGNAQEISEHCNDSSAAKANSIVQSSDKILFLVNQMLNLSKIEEGRVPMHFVQTDLVAFARFIVGSYQGYAESKKIRLHFEPQCTQLIMDIEAEKLEDVLTNLLSNAIKYTPEGGDVFVTVRRLIHAKSSVQLAEISVRDTGIGIPDDQLDKIFIRFYRVEGNQFPYLEGTGIGLTLVKEYLKLMKGTISVSSNLGRGSEFLIALPISNNAKIETSIAPHDQHLQMASNSMPAICETGSNSNQPRLLIVEDNNELRDYLTGLLENEYKILTAKNGIQGVDMAIAHVPDVILSDVMMPGKDGFQLCSVLKSDFRTNHIPIVLLTARADTESRIAGLEHGADAYLTKPFHKKELIICLHNLLVQRETLRIKYSATVNDKAFEEKEAGLNVIFLKTVTGHLENNYKNDRYGIQNLHADLGISRVQLHRKLTALTGLSASIFIRNFRLQKAKKLLLENGKNVSDIAFEVGIPDASYFTQAFTSEYGLTPTEMRKSLF